MSLRGHIDSLCADFVRDLFAALREASLEELLAHARPEVARGARAALRADREPAPTAARPPAKKRTAKATKATKATKAESAAAAKAEPDVRMTDAALRFFSERGARGATAAQLADHLASGGFERSEDIVRSLAAAGAIRDAGIRRATGKGKTSAVYVASAPASA